jgi:hypothetical protein
MWYCKCVLLYVQNTDNWNRCEKMSGLEPNMKELIKPKKFDLNIIFKNLDNKRTYMEHFTKYKLWYYKRRLKFLEEMIDLLYGNQDILQNESILFDVFCQEQQDIIDAINKKYGERK